MQYIETSKELQSAIRQLEYLQTEQAVLLKEQLSFARSRVRPLVIFKSPLSRLVGGLLQFGFTALITKNSGILGFVGQRILQGIFRKKDRIS